MTGRDRPRSKAYHLDSPLTAFRKAQQEQHEAQEERRKLAEDQRRLLYDGRARETLGPCQPGTRRCQASELF